MGCSRLVAGACVTALVAGGAQAGEPGAGFQVESYSVEITPDLATGAVSGTEVIVVEATVDGVAQLVFSPNALAIADARLGDDAIEVASTQDGIGFTLPRALAKGESARLRFAIAGTPKRGVTLVPSGLYTGYFACDWMVCLQDAPGDKADLALTLTVPPEAESLGVGERVSVALSPGGASVHEWQSTRPVSPYLYAFAVGDFPSQAETLGESRLQFINATGAPADLGQLFAATAPMLAFFQDRAGVPLPAEGYAQLLVPGGEAQEAASFSLIGAGHLAHEAEKPEDAWVIAHEFAHQWWGNLVTCSSWKEFWLNEGFATFMTAAWKEQSMGEGAYQAEMDRWRDRRAQLAGMGYDTTLVWDGKYPSLGVRRAVQYSKGALFLAILREAIGEDAFWSGVKLYTQRHAGGTVTSADLQRAFEETSEEDLSPLFAEWVYGGPNPESPMLID